MGDAHPGGNGSLYAVIRVKPHPKFQVVGNDLVTDVKIPLAKALRGGEIEVEDIFGKKTRIVLPHPCQYGHQAVLKGKGIAGGDLRVSVYHVLPDIKEDQINLLPKFLTEV
jgi:DnaJ-class molecular chaperone